MYNYYSSPLEDYIRELYQNLNIHTPDQMDLMTIATKLNIWMYFTEWSSEAINRSNMPSINIYKDQSDQEQWQDFGHELCHILQQAGNQTNMPKPFLKYQESKADNFAYHFCVPTFMLLDLELPQYEQQAIKYVSETFNVTLTFARTRLKMYQRQINSSNLTEQLLTKMDAEHRYKQEIGCDYIHESVNKTYLINRNRGIVAVFDHSNK